MKIAIYCVNYHSYDSLRNYIESIESAVIATKENVDVDLFIADNSCPPEQFLYSSRNIQVDIVPTGENLGYFGAVSMLMRKHNPAIYDYVIISNVDILLSDDFFCKLLTNSYDKNVGWIAPQIYSKQEQRDRNPKILHRYPKRKLQILRWLFQFPPLYNLYTHTIYKSKKLISHQPGCIYAGHGSFIILTKHYFEKCGIIDYPVFLFCEEIYLGEQCLQNNLKVVYNPAIIVADCEHVSTSTFRRRQYCKYNFEAIDYIIKTYY